MNPEIKAEWCERLRNGERKQGTCWLVRDNKYCCLGVLSEMAEEAGIVEKRWTKDYDDEPTEHAEFLAPGTTGMGWAAGISDEVRMWAGLPQSFGSLGYFHEGSVDGLASMNDMGSSFSEIADVIEEKW